MARRPGHHGHDHAEEHHHGAGGHHHGGSGHSHAHGGGLLGRLRHTFAYSHGFTSLPVLIGTPIQTPRATGADA